VSFRRRGKRVAIFFALVAERITCLSESVSNLDGKSLNPLSEEIKTGRGKVT